VVKVAGISRNFMAASGYFEVVTWSFMSSKKAQSFGQLQSQLVISNPISSDLNYMRTNIIANLLEAVEQNYNRSHKQIRLFEIGPVFKAIDREVLTLGGIVYGNFAYINPHEAPRMLDIFDIKGDLVNLLTELGINVEQLSLASSNKIYYHPNVSASLSYLGKKIGALGQIHPSITKDYGIDGKVFAFELELDNLTENLPLNSLVAKSERNPYVSSNTQSAQRDLAFIVDKNLPVGDMLEEIKALDVMIKDVRVFDVYEGANLEEGKKSVAINLLLQLDRNLLSEEINELCKRIINEMKNKFLAALRS
jgi:phenylalanyl-tRNA synthetase beta chain